MFLAGNLNFKLRIVIWSKIFWRFGDLNNESHFLKKATFRNLQKLVTNLEDKLLQNWKDRKVTVIEHVCFLLFILLFLIKCHSVDFFLISNLELKVSKLGTPEKITKNELPTLHSFSKRCDHDLRVIS